MTTPNGERVGFTFTPVRQQIIGTVYYTPKWVADAGVNYTLQSVDAKLTSAGGKFYELTSGAAYNPASSSFNGTEYTLTAVDGTKYLLDSKQGLVGQIAPNGTKLIYSDSGIIATTGEAIGFVKDKAGRITEITAPDGTQLAYEYDAQGQLGSVHNNTTGKVQSFGYNATGQLQALVGDASVVIDPTTGTTRPLQANLLGIANLNDNPLTTTTAPNQTYSFNVQASELNTTSSHTLLIGVEGDGTSQINGVAPVYTQGNYRIFTVDKAGINLLDISNPLLRVTNYELRVIGDLNRDGKVDGVDSQLLTNAFTKPFDTKFDLNRDGVINALDLQLLGGNYGFVAAGKQPSNPIPTKLGTVRTTPSGITLLEGAGLVTQMTKSIAIDRTPGKTQFISFDLNPAFDLSDRTSIIEDQFAVHLVDPTTHQTLLDRGESGTSLFSLTGKTAEYAKGLVTYNGQRVSIDLGSLTNVNNAELVFQLINHDNDTTGAISIQNITDTLTQTPAGTLIGAPPTRVTPGAAIANLTTYTHTTAPKVQLTNVRLDSTTGKFIANLQIENTGTTPLPRQLAILFPNLPAGVTLVTKSGVTGAGTPYINLHDTMNVGGLAPNETNTAISIEFDDINLVRLDLHPTFLAGAPDVAPTLRALGTINLTPGQVFSIPLIAVDPNGAPITMIVDTKGALPTGTLTGDNTLIFNPTPEQLGTYTFTLIAKQGLLTTSETVTLNVIADAITTTRLSGKVNRDKLTALGGAVVDIGGVQTTTNADGSFLITLPTNTATTVKINGVTQQLSQLLGHQLYSGVNNQVGSTIYIPTVDTSGTQTSGNTVTNTNLPKVILTLPNSPTLLPPIGLGSIDSSLIPEELFATGTPKFVVAVTTTGTLATPVKLTLGNNFSVEPGTMMDLWRIDPNTGIPTIVGVGKVNSDGTLIETMSGGVIGAGWYYYVPTPVAQQSPDDNAYNPISTLDVTPVTVPINSEANLFTGEVSESYQLQGYQSLGVNQSLQLTYSSRRANPEQVIPFEYKAFTGSNLNGVFAQLNLKTGDFQIAGPRYQWELTTPPVTTPVQSALKIDTSTLVSGVYAYDLVTGMNSQGALDFIQSQNRTTGSFAHINKKDTFFGNGWGLAGLQKIIINNQNFLNESLLLIDGNGTEQLFTVIDRTAGSVTKYGSKSGNPSTFMRLANGTFERKLIDGTTYKFNTAGQITSVEDRHTNTTTYSYNGVGVLDKIRDAAGLETTFMSSGDKITIVKDPAGRSTNIEYAGDNIKKIKDPDLTITEWKYNTKNLITKSIDKLGNSGTDYYDTFGRVYKATKKDGSEVNFVNPVTLVTGGLVFSTQTPSVSTQTIPLIVETSEPEINSIDGNGNVTKLQFNRFGQVVKVKDDFGVKLNAYNSRGSVIQTTDEKGNKISYRYDDKNQIVEIAYGDKLSTEQFALYNNQSDKTPTAANVNHIAYLKDLISTTNPATSVTTTAQYQYLITSDNRGQIISSKIAEDGLFTGVSSSFSLRTKLKLNTVDKLTVKKLIVGDFNQDGIQDIAVGYSKEVFNANINTEFTNFTYQDYLLSFTNTPVYTNSAGIAILTGVGNGDFNLNSNTFINPTSNVFDNYQFEIADLVAADFDNDGKVDIAAANFIEPNAANWLGANNYQLYVLKNDGFGKFSSVKGNSDVNRTLKLFKSVDNKGILATAKDTSGKNLLIVASPATNANTTLISTFSCNSDGELNDVSSYSVAGVVKDIKTIDLNGDGAGEIIVNANRLSVINTVTGVIQTSAYTTQNTGFWSFLDIADANGDNIKDIFVANDNQTLKVFLGTSTGGIPSYDLAPQIYQGTSSPRGLIVRNINGDNLPDVIVGDAFAGLDIKLHVNTGISASTSVVSKLFEYDPTFGQLTKSIDEEGRVTLYDINPTNGDVNSITKQGSGTTPDSTTSFIYTGNPWGLVSKITDAEGKVTENTYDPRGRLTQIVQGGIIVSTLTYDPLSGNIITKKDGNNKITQYTYKTDTNRIETETHPDGLGITTYSYDPRGLLTSVLSTDTFGTYGQKFDDYDGLGRAKTITQLTVKGAVVQKYEYYNNGEIKSVTNSDNQKIENTLDTRNRLKLVKNIDDSVTKYTYDELNNLTQVIDAEEYVTDYLYDTPDPNDSRTRLTQTSKQIQGTTNLVTKYLYNKALQLKQATDGNGETTTYNYDDLGRQHKVTQQLDIALDSGATEIINSTEYFNNGNIKSITDGNGHKTSYIYDARNLKSTSIDELSNKTTYTYDDAGNLATVNTANLNPLLYPNAASITYKYDALNRRTKVIDVLMGEANTTYDLSGNVRTFEDANHHSTQYDYTPAIRALITTDAKGNKTNTLYDTLGRTKTITQLGDLALSSDDRTTTYNYDLTTNTTTVHRPEGVVETTKLDSLGNTKLFTTTVNGIAQTTAYKYNGLNKLTKITDALTPGNTQEFEYDNLGNLTTTTTTDNQFGGIHTTYSQSNNIGWNTRTTDAQGQVFTTSYDAVGNIKQQTENGALRTTTYQYDVLNRNTQVTTVSGADTLNTYTTYDAVGNILSHKDAQGNTTTYKYDILNRRNKVIDAKNQDTDYVYDAVGNLKEIIDTPTRKTVYTYNNLNRQTEVKDAENIVTLTTYNPFGEAIAITQNSGGSLTRTTQYEYDKLGRKVKTIDPLNHITTTTYDEADNVRTVTDANNNTTTYDYDKLNRQIEVKDANNIITQINTYDGFGNIKSIKDASGNITRYEYDLLDRLTKTIDPRSKETTQDYDGLGRVKEITDRNNRTRTFAYDINDNLTTETWGNGTKLTYTYDKVSNLKSSIDQSSSTTNSYDYDPIYQLTGAGTSNSNVRFEYTYDEFGDRTQRKDLQGTTTIAKLDYTYNNNHQLKHLTQLGVGLTTQDIDFTYDKLSQLRKIDRSVASNLGHLVTDYQYDGAGRLFDIVNKFNTTPISNYTYGYDDGNRLSSKNGTDGISALDYERDNQLKLVDNATRPDESYSFNALGIRAGWVTDTVDKRRVLNDGKYQYLYDDEGNLTQKTEIATSKVTTYEWDYRNRLMKVTSGAQTVEYGYDAEDRRVSKKINGVVKEKYVYDGSNIALVVDAAGTLVERYLYGDGVDNVLSRVSAGATVWSLGDRQGSVVDLVDEGGSVLNHFVYDSFGGRTQVTGVDFRFGFTGRELDTETGLYYYRARYYDSGLGRFISEDPIGFSAGDTNLYRYVNNSPTNFTDPTGMWLNFAIGAAIGGVLDLGLQLWEQKGDFSKIDPTRLAISTITGALGGGIGAGLSKGGFLLKGTQFAKEGLGLGARTAITAGAEFNLGYWGKVAENKITGKTDVLDGALLSGAIGGIAGAGGELISTGIGAWGKQVRLDRVGNQLDNLADETQDLIRQLDDLGAANQKLNVEWNVAQSREARAGSKFGAFSKEVQHELWDGSNQKLKLTDNIREKFNAARSPRSPNGFQKDKLRGAIDYHYEDQVRKVTGGKSEMINEFEIDSVTDTALHQVKRAPSATDKPKSFIKHNRVQIKNTIEFANQLGKTAEFWFKYGVHGDVRRYIVERGGIVHIGLGE